MVHNGRIHDLILNPDQTHMIRDIIAESGFYGMQTFDQALLALYRAGMVTLDDAMRTAVRAKFTQHADLKEILLGTGDEHLIEHTANDAYWADGGDGSGRNMLGRILMEVRAELAG